MRGLVFYISTLLLLSSCFKEETPMQLKRSNPNSTYAKLDCNTETNAMVFYDFSSNSYKSAPNSDWDIAFDAKAYGSSMRLNLTRTNFKLYEYSSDNFNLSADYIMANGVEKMDSVSDWYSGNVVNCGVQHGSKIYVYHHEGGMGVLSAMKCKFMVKEISDKAYKMIYHNEVILDAKPMEIIIQKDDNYNFNYFSFAKNINLPNFEPLKTDWDIVFTQYRDMVLFTQDNKYYPYQVLGTLTNPYKTHVHEFANTERFADINSMNNLKANWSTQADKIGFDWKYYSMGNGIYTTDTTKFWAVRDQRDYVYKFRFTNYYNNKGESGYPSMEFIKLP